ncbi:MAG: hypothetical protein K2Q26_11150 [Bdellovibrionales bacterium]|nr:hypothetical protein [Bdellovibrionales bacterium]
MKLFSLVVLIMIFAPTSSYAIPSLNSNDRKECIQRVQIECRSGISRVDRAFFTYDHGYIWNMRLKNGGSAFCARQVIVDWMD